MAQKRVPIGTLKGPRGFTGPRGLPGVNAVEADAAYATYATAPGSDTYAALDARRRMAPAYVSTPDSRAGEFDPALVLYRQSSPDMVNAMLNVAVSRAGNTDSHILFVGDSKTAGNGADNFGSNLPSRVRDLLGASDGFAYAGHAMAPRADTRWSATNFRYLSKQLYLASNTGAASITFTSSRACEGFRLVWFVQTPVAPLTVSIDGGAAVPLESDGIIYPNEAPTGYYYKDFTGLTLGNHSIKVDATVGSGGELRVLGVMHLFTKPRLTVSNAGLSGTTVDDWLPEADRFKLFANAVGPVQTMGRRIVVVQLGTNVTATQQTNFGPLVDRLRAMGHLVILVAPGGASSFADRLAFKKFLYDTADAKNLPLVDFTALIGATGSGGASGPYMVDNLHENQRGYDYEAATLARVLAA